MTPARATDTAAPPPPPAHRRAPRPMPRVDRWPEAVRSAELLRGALVRCGPGVRPVGWPEMPRTRAAALAPWLDPDRIAIRMSAAWVWGAARLPGAPLEFSTLHGRRPPLHGSADHLLHQFDYDESAIHRFDAFAVTTPERTAFDLLRAPERFERPQRVACRLLLQLVAGGRAGLAGRLADHPHPNRALARRRLELL